MANPYTDPRYQMARLMRAQARPQGAASIDLGAPARESAVRLGRAASNMATSNTGLRASIEAIANGKTQAQPKGVMGAVLGNPLTKAVLAPLELLALPGRATVATLREAVDAFDGNDATKASFRDFRTNMKDKAYGVGKAFKIDTGSIWVDRALGFAGDLALDPLTYATFGAGKFAGYAGRLDLAKAVLSKTGDEALANAVQRFGRSAIKDAEILERVGAQRHGIYFLGKRIKVGKNGQGLRLPGSGAIGQLGDAALSRLRVSAMGTKGGKWLQKMTLPSDALAARQALLQGKVSNKASAVVISFLTAEPIARTTAGEVLQREKTLLADFLQREGTMGLEGYKTEVYKYLENPALLADASPEMQRAAKEWADVFEWYEKQVDEAIQAADPTHEFAARSGYYPRVQTDAAFEYRSNAANPYSRQLNEIHGRDPLEGGGNFKTRTLREGDDWFGHKLTADEANSVEKLNEIARPHLGGADFYETDITRVIPKYVDEFSKEMGLLARHKHLADTGFWKRAEEVSVTGEFIDKELVDAIKAQVKSLDDEMAALHKQSADAALGLVQAMTDRKNALLKELEDLESVTGALGAREEIARASAALDDVLRGTMTLTADQMQAVADSVGGLGRKLATMFGFEVKKGGRIVLEGTDTVAEDAPNILHGLVAYLDNLEDDVMKLRTDLYALEQDWVGKELADRAAAASERAGLTAARLLEAQNKVKELMEFGNQLESSLDAVLRGASVDSNDISQAVLDVLAVTGVQGTLTNSKTAELLAQALGAAGGDTQKLVAEMLKDEGGLFKTLTQLAGVRSDVVKKMSVADFNEMLPKMFTGELTMSQIREMGLWALLHDDVLMARVPEALLPARAKLVQALEAADLHEAMIKQWAKEQRAGGRVTIAKLWAGIFESSQNKASNARSIIDDGNRFLASDYAAKMAAFGDVEIPSELAEAIARDYPSLSKYLSSTDEFDEYMELMGAFDDVGRSAEGVFAGGRMIRDRGMVRGDTGGLTVEDLFAAVRADIQQAEAFLDETIEFGVGIGKKTLTHRQVLEIAEESDRIRAAIKGRRNEIEAEYQRVLKGEMARYTAKQLENEEVLALVKSNARARAYQVVERRTSSQGRFSLQDMQAKLRELTGGNSRMIEGFMGATKRIQQEDLAQAVMTYTMVSEVIRRFEAVSAMLRPYGLAPAEKHFAAITRNVGNKFLPIVDRHLNSVNKAYVILRMLDEKIAQGIATRGEKSINAVFREAMSGLSDSDREFLVEAVGSRISWSADPYELRKGITNARKNKEGKVIVGGKEINATTAAENEYLEKHVRPWFEVAFPGKTPTKEAMKKALSMFAPSTRRGARSQYVTPWATDATPTDVKRFFEEIIGESVIPGRSSKRLGTARMGGNMGGDKMYGVPIMIQSSDLATKRKKFLELYKRLNAMTQPDADMKLFLDDPTAVQRTPTFYASVLRNQIDRMSERVLKGADIEANINITQRDVADAASQAAGKAAAAAGLKSGVIPDALAKEIEAAVGKVSAYTKWETRSAEISSELNDVRMRLEVLPSRGGTAQQRKQLAALRKRRDALVSEGKKLKQPEKPTKRESELASYGSTKPGPRETPTAPRRPSPASEAARRELERYNDMMQDVMYGRAKQDKEMTDALEVLSSSDLWRFTDGFSLDGQTYATMPDGTRIVFTREEWDSLFFAAGDQEQLADAAVRAIENSRSSRAAVLEAQRRRETLVRIHEGNVARQTEMTGRAWGAAKSKIDATVEASRGALDELDAEISRLVSEAQDAAAHAVAAAPQTRAVALEKARILILGSDTSPAIFGAEGLERFKVYGTPFQRQVTGAAEVGMPGVRMGRLNAVDKPSLKVNVDEFNRGVVGVPTSEASRRVWVLRAQWQASEEYQFLQRLAEMEKKIFVAQYKKFLESSESMSEHLATLQSALDGHLTRLAENKAAVAADAAAAAQTVEKGRAGLADLGVDVPAPAALETVDDLTSAASAIEAGVGQVRPGRATEDIGASMARAEGLELVGVRSIQDEAAIAERQMATTELADWQGTEAPYGRATMGRSEYEIQKKGVPKGERARRTVEAKKAWEARTKRYNEVKQIVEAVRDKQSAINAEITIRYGDIGSLWMEIYAGRAMAESLRTQIREIDELMTNLPPKEIMDVLRKASKNKRTPEGLQAALESYRTWRTQAGPIARALADNPDDPVNRAFAASHLADGQLIDIELEHADRLLQLSNAQVPVWRTLVVQPLEEGYEKAAREAGMLEGTSLKGDPRLLGLRGDSEAVELLQNISRIREPGVVDDMSRFMRGYTGFFRSYATLSPGFHVRNTISNVFSMFAGGADMKNIREGFRLWRLMDDHLGRGGTLQTWAATLPEEQRDFGLKAARIVLGLGGGKTDDALEAFARAGSEGIVRNNAMIRGSRKVGHKVEGSARFMMAYDSLVKGMDENVAFNRTRRFLIDYQEKTLLDATMRDIIPFWTWMSRNLPLQIINRWTNPKAYLVYQRAYNNFNEQDQTAPAWLQKEQAIGLGGGKFLNLDLPSTGINEQVQGLTNPSQLMGYVNPGLRVPVEMLANRSFFSGQEFKDDYVKLDGKFSMLLPVFAAAGQVEYNSKGDPMVRKKALYAMNNMVPFLSRADRLFPSDTSDSAKMQNAVNGFLGIPIRNVSEGMVDSENYRRLAQLQAMMEKRKNLG
jgi:hypothetical protein